MYCDDRCIRVVRARERQISGAGHEYSIGSFFRDLPEMREKPFTKAIIQGSFRKSGIWPIKVQNALELTGAETDQKERN